MRGKSNISSLYLVFFICLQIFLYCKADDRIKFSRTESAPISIQNPRENLKMLFDDLLNSDGNKDFDTQLSDLDSDSESIKVTSKFWDNYGIFLEWTKMHLQQELNSPYSPDVDHQLFFSNKVDLILDFYRNFVLTSHQHILEGLDLELHMATMVDFGYLFRSLYEPEDLAKYLDLDQTKFAKDNSEPIYKELEYLIRKIRGLVKNGAENENLIIELFNNMKREMIKDSQIGLLRSDLERIRNKFFKSNPINERIYEDYLYLNFQLSREENINSKATKIVFSSMARQFAEILRRKIKDVEHVSRIKQVKEEIEAIVERLKDVAEGKIMSNYEIIKVAKESQGGSLKIKKSLSSPDLGSSSRRKRRRVTPSYKYSDSILLASQDSDLNKTFLILDFHKQKKKIMDLNYKKISESKDKSILCIF